MPSHPDLQAEQAHIDRAYRRLEAMRAAAMARRDEVLDQGRGTPQAIEEREVIVRTAAARLEQLRLGRESLCFGRIDRAEGDRFYIGRLAVADEDFEPLVVDWRAPVAEPFYRATGVHPMGLTRRRHFLTEGQRVVGIEDELLDIDAADDVASLIGEGALIASLERVRSGSMRDIVATIQTEQDQIIRAPTPGVLVVQGGPGTGKTAVALHRAAYLLYTFRFPLERQGVLVVGPNPIFLRYIEHVLPSLGETGVTLSTVAGLYSPERPTGIDSPVAARVKGDARMSKVLRRAVGDRQRALPRDVTVPFGAHALRLTRDDSAEIVAAVKRRPGTHNARRPQVQTMVLRHLFDQLDAAYERARRTGIREPTNDSAPDLSDFTEAARALPEVQAALDRMWPLLTPEELLHDWFGAPVLIDLAAGSRLEPSERAALHRARSVDLEDVEWTPADVPLLDELSVLLGPRRRSANGELRTYGHIVVDEAQDLSPMQLRMLARRSLDGSMTVVGDIGQATGAWAPASWDDVLAHLPGRRTPTLTELTVNYRTPAEIMEIAARVLATAAPHLTPPRSVRSTEERPAVVATALENLETAVASTALRMLDDLGGTVAVICASSLVAALVDAVGPGSDEVLDAPVSVVAVENVKGLEFDGVVVVEPALIAEESSKGLRALYVALTRATRSLAIVHARPLPAVLGV